MNLFKRIVLAAISGSMFLASFAVTNPVFAANTDVSVVDSLSANNEISSSLPVITYTEAVNSESMNSSESPVTTTAVDNENQQTATTTAAESISIPAGTSKVNDKTTDDNFEVFDIYQAHQEYMQQTTTTATTTKVTTTTTKVITSIDASKGIKGIDVSKWQGDINWTKVKNDGINFAIIRAGYGNTASQKDPKFDYNMNEAAKAGIDRGVYWYSYAKTVEEAYKEADACYSVIKGYNFEYPLMFDIEDSSQAALSTATVSAIVEAFCKRMEERGYYVSIYSYASFLSTKIYASVLTRYDVVVAHYNVSTPRFTLPYGIWQYSSTGSVNGITGNVDLDYAYKDYPYLISKYHKNGY